MRASQAACGPSGGPPAVHGLGASGPPRSLRSPETPADSALPPRGARPTRPLPPGLGPRPQHPHRPRHPQPHPQLPEGHCCPASSPGPLPLRQDGVSCMPRAPAAPAPSSGRVWGPGRGNELTCARWEGAGAAQFGQGAKFLFLGFLFRIFTFRLFHIRPSDGLIYWEAKDTLKCLKINLNC